MDIPFVMGMKRTVFLPAIRPPVAISVRTDPMFAIPFAINLHPVAVILRPCRTLSCNQRAHDPPMFAIPTADVCRSLQLLELLNLQSIKNPGLNRTPPPGTHQADIPRTNRRAHRGNPPKTRRGSKCTIFGLHGRTGAAGFRGRILVATLASAAGGGQPPQIKRVGVGAVRGPAASASADGFGRSSLRAGFCLDVPHIGCA
jgi:hypothetical protein